MAEIPGISHELAFKKTIVLSFRLYGRNFRGYVIVFLLAAGISGLIDLAIEAIYPTQTVLPSGSFLEQLNYQLAILPQSVFTILLVSPVTSICNGIGVSLTADMLGNRQASLRTGWKSAIERIRQLWYVTLLTGLLTTLGYILVLPGILFEIIFFVTVPVVMIEKSSALNALKRSRLLVSHRWRRIFGFILISGLTVLIPTLIINQVFLLLSPASILASSAVSGFSAPFYITLITTSYYSNVARLEEKRLESEQVPGSAQRRWVCRNCGTSFMATSMPSQTAFGGCPKAKTGLFRYRGKHDWVVTQTTNESSSSRGP